MAKSETRAYIDTNPADLPAEVQEMLKQDRALYEQQKAIRETIVRHLNATMPLKGGYEVVGVGFTRWGQFQLHADLPQVKQAKASNRPSLADFLAQSQDEGRRS